MKTVMTMIFTRLMIFTLDREADRYCREPEKHATIPIILMGGGLTVNESPTVTSAPRWAVYREIQNQLADFSLERILCSNCSARAGEI